MPLTVSPTTTCPDTFTSLHTQLSLSVHAPLVHAPAFSFTQGSAMSHPPCHTTYITYQTRSFQPRCPFVSTKSPLWFMYVFITARYNSYSLCTDWETLSTALLILDICPRHRGRRQRFSAEQTRQTSHSGTTLLGLRYNKSTPIAHISFSTRNKVVF